MAEFPRKPLFTIAVIAGSTRNLPFSGLEIKGQGIPRQARNDVLSRFFIVLPFNDILSIKY